MEERRVFEKRRRLFPVGVWRAGCNRKRGRGKSECFRIVRGACLGRIRAEPERRCCVATVSSFRGCSCRPASDMAGDGESGSVGLRVRSADRPGMRCGDRPAKYRRRPVRCRKRCKVLIDNEKSGPDGAGFFEPVVPRDADGSVLFRFDEEDRMRGFES